MCHAIRINQPSRVGSIIIEHKGEEGSARHVVDAINEAKDETTTAEYLGRASRIHLTFAAKSGPEAPSLRRQAMEQYDRALPHRIALDVIDIKATDESFSEYECYVLGGWRAKTEG